MRVITITKDDILDALETEPLMSGAFINWDGCRACAVGATLRKKLGPQSSNEDLISELGNHLTKMCCTEDDIAPRGNWMAALSIVWETLNFQARLEDHFMRSREDYAEELRWDIWQWAEENIPDDYEVEVAV